MKQALWRLIWDEEGQETFEYVLLLGGAAIIIVAALVAGFILIAPQALDNTCPTIDPLAPAGESCVTR